MKHTQNFLYYQNTLPVQNIWKLYIYFFYFHFNWEFELFWICFFLLHGTKLNLMFNFYSLA